jgi:hypothetical protein
MHWAVSALVRREIAASQAKDSDVDGDSEVPVGAEA